MRRLLVLRGGALGDLLLTLPALAALRARWPGAILELAGNAVAGVLARDAGLAQVVHDQNEARWAQLYRVEPLEPAFREFLRGFDLIVSYWPDPEKTVASHFGTLGGVTVIQASHAPRGQHAADFFQEPLLSLGISRQPPVYRLRTGITRRPEIALHPGSGSRTKNWPLERWQEIARRLRRETSMDLLILKGPAEESLPSFDDAMLASNLALPLLATRLAQCRLFVGHDSGTSHLAAACGVDSVLLFGPTDPAIWAPRDPRVRVIVASGGIASLEVDPVLNEVLGVLTDRR